MTTARYELKITATGELRDADGNLLDKDGNPVEPDEDVQPEADEKEKP